jgi:phosphoglycerate dehydrogenase-like enzyme
MTTRSRLTVQRLTPGDASRPQLDDQEEGVTGNDDSRVRVLGTGLMGTAMPHRLLNQGVSIIAWDRQPEHAQALAERG